jgi:hypothetical protein
MRTRSTEDDPYPDYERRLDALDATDRQERWRRRGFWGLGVVVLAASLGLLQVLSQQGAGVKAPTPAPVPAQVTPAPPPAPVTKVQAKRAPTQPKVTGPGQSPQQDAQFCQKIGRFAGMVATDRDNGWSWPQEVAAIQRGGFPPFASS